MGGRERGANFYFVVAPTFSEGFAFFGFAAGHPYLDSSCCRQQKHVCRRGGAFDPREIMSEGDVASQSSRIRPGTGEGTPREPASSGSSFALPRGATRIGGRHREDSRRVMAVMANGSGDGAYGAGSPLEPLNVSSNSVDSYSHSIIHLQRQGRLSPLRRRDLAALAGSLYEVVLFTASVH